MQLIIGNKNYSSWSLRAWLLLSHFDVPFEEIRIPLDTPEFDSTLTQYSKAGKVPVLQDNELEIWDSLAICEYISEQYLDGKGWPSEPAARAQARSASAEMHSSFFAIRNNMPMNCRAQRIVEFSADMLDEIKRIDQLWSQLRKHYASDGEYLLGNFSIADCMYAPMASRFHTYQPELSDTAQQYVASIIDHPQIKLWYQQASEEGEVLEAEETGQPRS